MVLKADLHMHSTTSDGGYSPSEVVRLCSKGELDLISLTDHDTTKGIAEAKKSAEYYNIRFIPGIELSTRLNGQSVDILGYGINVTDSHLQETLAFHRSKREQRMAKMVEKCRKHDLDVTFDDVEAQVTGETYSRPHLAKALIKQGYGETVQEIFERYIGYGKPCYVMKEKEMSPQEAIKLIHEAGGVAIVAHPIYYDIDEAIFTWCMEDGLDGIEVYHRDHPPQVIERFNRLAERVEKALGKSLLKTGGSDFHHEDFGREGEQLGVTKLPFHEAEKLWDLCNR
ncbi:PHP domain-containing protein [Salipaludibacillus sp. LMS25]|jgi:predicted metal-dependent phosphoesterase TrpH|uniref:PHP domain-containing protein n=1 Tax=Salipaludibacillus sp. LMS25 TaxID=2924031 RepID=UPI0020D09A90|nr:PHP domain-containing protein [Salipaludibacillus sp. LMS25]UTR14949.1 PHP domain-containing protein [Salipaludibacillus sp. LMS25]